MKMVPLQSLVERNTRSAGKDKYPVLSITAGVGFVNQAEKFGKEIAGAQYVHYTVLRKGDFSYNKGNSKTYPQGCIYRQDEYERAAVPNVFNSFRFISSDASTDYYKYLFESGYLNHQLYRLINSGVRNDGLLNLYDDDFYSCKVPCPPLPEQRKIAEVLGCCDRVITLKKELIAEKKRQKKALMQKLLNPASGFRLPGFTGEWQLESIGNLASSKGDYGINAPACAYSPKLPKYIRITDIDDNCKFIRNNNAHVNVRNYRDYVLQESDIVFVRTGATVGKSYVYDPEDGEIVFAGFLIRFRFEEPMADFRFIKQIVSTDKYFQWVNIMSARSGQPGINAEEYASYSFMAPDLKEQQAIADILSAADQELGLLEQELAQQQQKKKSLMQLLLTGIARV